MSNSNDEELSESSDINASEPDTDEIEEISELSSNIDESESDTDEIEEGSNEAAFYPLIEEAWQENSEEWHAEKKHFTELGYSEHAAKAVAEQSLLGRNFKTFMKKYSKMIVVWYHLQLNELHNNVFDNFEELKEKWNLEYAAEKAVKKHAAELKHIVQQESAEAELDSSDEDDSISDYDDHDDDDDDDEEEEEEEDNERMRE